MIEQIRRLLEHRLSARVLAIAIAAIFTANLAALGPVGDTDDKAGGSLDRPDGTTGGFTPTPGGSLLPSGSALPSATPSAGGSLVPGTTTGGGTTTTTTGGTKLPPGGIPRWGLRTQGVTDKVVKVGVSYNVAACGDAAAIEAMLGAAGGDQKKTIETFERHINDTGGIGGRTFDAMIFDDGGPGCPEKNVAAAVSMLEEKKVFMAIPGLHVESDYLIKRSLPVFGGRPDPESLRKYGPNGLMVEVPYRQTFDAWASFGRYYLDTLPTVEDLDGTSAQPKCLIRIESGAAGDFDTAQRLLVESMTRFGLKFKRILVFKDDVSTAQTQATSIAIQARDADCEQAWFMAGNPIGLIFFTSAATQNDWHPRWTFTGQTALSDSDLAGNLMDPEQWENAVGLSTRVPSGEHRAEGNCQRIYERYNGNDGMSNSASVQIYCAKMLTTAEIMRRAVKRTGVLTGDSLLVGAHDITYDFYYDAHVPMDFRFPDLDGPFRTRGFSHYTVVDWNSDRRTYEFPKYPCYYETFGPKNAGCTDFRRYYKK